MAAVATNFTHFTERDQRSLERILDSFEKTQSRANSLYSRVRRHDRKPYRGAVSILALSEGVSSPPANLSGLPLGWVYSLSQGGVGFLSLEPIEAEFLLIGLHLPNGTIKWLSGSLVRRREIPEERFIDYGMAFGKQLKS